VITFDPKYCLIIAEAGLNHNGDLDLAISMIEEAAKSEADIIKFQTISRETNFNFAIPDKDIYPFVEKASFSFEEYQILKNKAEEEDIIFMSSAADVPAARLLHNLGVPGIKISSGNFSNFHLLSEVVKHDVPIILSSGISDMAEMDETYNYLRQSGSSNFAFLYCVSEYPGKLESIDFDRMIEMKNRYNIPTGFSDHSLGGIAAVVARTLGACVIEKHFTLDKNLDGPDHHFSIDPSELKDLVKQIRNVEQLLFQKGAKSTAFLESHLKRSLYANKDINQGNQICFDDIAAKRPYSSEGVSPKDFEQIVGKVALRDFKKEELIKQYDDKIQ